MFDASALDAFEAAIGEQGTGSPASKRGNECAENGRGYIECEQEAFAILQESKILGAKCRERSEGADQANTDTACDRMRYVYAPVEPLIDDIDDVASHKVDEQGCPRKALGRDDELDQVTERCADRPPQKDGRIKKRRRCHDLLARRGRVLGLSSLGLFVRGRHATILGERMRTARDKWGTMQKDS